MAILDNLNLLSDAQSLIIAVGAANSTNVMDLGIGRDLGAGRPLFLNMHIETAVTSGGAGTLQIQMVVSAAAALTTPTVLWDSGALAKTVYALGLRWSIPVPRLKSTGTPLRYLGLIYTVATADLTAGAISAWIDIMGDQDSRYAASGFTVN